MTLHELNNLPKNELVIELTRCCGSKAWVQKMLPYIPADDLVELLEDAEEQWWSCSEEDWKEAFAAHPKIGERSVLSEKKGSETDWAWQEQKQVQSADAVLLADLATANRIYEEKFGYIFIVCATGKSALEMLEIVNSRLPNEPGEELKIAADEQWSITKLRLEKLLD